MDIVTIELNTADAEHFKSFQEHYKLFTILKSKGAFDIQFGKCILNFAHGELQNVIKEEVVYHK